MNMRLKMIEGIYNIKPSDIEAQVALNAIEGGGASIHSQQSISNYTDKNVKQKTRQGVNNIQNKFGKGNRGYDASQQFSSENQ